MYNTRLTFKIATLMYNTRLTFKIATLMYNTRYNTIMKIFRDNSVVKEQIRL